MSKKKCTLETFQSTGVYDVPLALDHVTRASPCTSKCLFRYALLTALSCTVKVVDWCQWQNKIIKPLLLENILFFPQEY